MTKIVKNWKILPGFKGKISKRSLPGWVFDVLANRGIKTEQEISSYLDPEYEGLFDSSVFKGTKEVVERIALAKQNKEKVVVYGDYDVDGITATALVSEVLNKIGIQNECYIPHREEEGYGLNEAAVKEIIKSGAELIIAVDCGISSKDVIDSQPKDIDFIVCDHHEIVKEKVPKNAIIIHPELLKGSDPNGIQLSACGMAFFLSRALQKEFESEFPLGQEKWLLDLTALATICDVIPLTGQNRILAKWGLSVISKTKRVGLLELMKVAGVKPGEINSYAVGFLLGPRLNAAGRLEHAKKALDLLLTKDPAKAKVLAEHLNKLNLERQKMCEKILAEAKAEIESGDKKDHEIFLLSNKNWPRGVVGIIASKLSDSYSRPVIIFEHDGKEHHGSARSVEGFDITEALSECEDCLLKFGGHAKAAGLSLSDKHFVVFAEKMLEITRNKIKKESLKPTVIIDTKIKADKIDAEMLDMIASFEPFGYGNHTPTFLLENAAIENIKQVGANKEHLKFSIKRTANSEQRTALGAIWFNYDMEITEKNRYDMVFTLRYNVWNNQKTIELRIIDMRVSD